MNSNGSIRSAGTGAEVRPPESATTEPRTEVDRGDVDRLNKCLDDKSRPASAPVVKKDGETMKQFDAGVAFSFGKTVEGAPPQSTGQAGAESSALNQPAAGQDQAEGMSNLFTQAVRGVLQQQAPAVPQKTATPQKPAAAPKATAARAEGGLLVKDKEKTATAEKEAPAPIQGLHQVVEGGQQPSSVAATEKVSQSRCEELVDQILVSQPQGEGGEEVRIRVDRSWLPETEIRLTKTTGSPLQVEFISDRMESQRFLMPNLADLRTRLAERTGETVQLRMSEHMDSDSGDGRSRNRRNIYEEIGGE